jgi:acetyltransferase-like isoleucine patch superfamily enzyme
LKEIDKKKNIRNILLTQRGSSLQKYRLLTAGDVSTSRFVYYELITSLLGARSGGLGILLRRKLYRKLFRSFGRNVIIGRNCVFRHPSRIAIGDNVVIDDNCIIDARGCEEDGLVLEEGVLISRNCAIQSKGGDIRIGRNVNLGADSQLVSWGGIRIGDGAAIAGGCYISAGSYKLDDFSTPISQRVPFTAGPVIIGNNAWIATRVTILDGVEIGENAVVSAGAVVSNSIKSKAVAHGNPAKVVFQGR